MADSLAGATRQNEEPTTSPSSHERHRRRQRPTATAQPRRDLSDLVRHAKIETTDLGECWQHFVFRPHLFSSGRRRFVRVEERWVRQAKLGSGSFGTVYLERCQSDGDGGDDLRLRAVKEIKKMDIENEGLDYTRELEAIAIFSHPMYFNWFVNSDGWFETSDSVFISMEYMEYGDLQAHLTAGRPLPEVEAREITTQVLKGLTYMHENDFIHRDLKPGNIMVVLKGPDWSVKLADFGICKRRLPEATWLQTSNRFTLGFAAPEQLGLVADAPSHPFAIDIWALGAVAFRILTESVPFQVSDLISYVNTNNANRGKTNRSVEEKFPPIAQLLEKGVSQVGQDFICALMRPLPGERPSAAEASKHDWIKQPLETPAGTMTDGHSPAGLRNHGDADVNMEKPPHENMEGLPQPTSGDADHPTGLSLPSVVWSSSEDDDDCGSQASDRDPATPDVDLTIKAVRPLPAYVEDAGSDDSDNEAVSKPSISAETTADADGPVLWTDDERDEPTTVVADAPKGSSTPNPQKENRREGAKAPDQSPPHPGPRTAESSSRNMAVLWMPKGPDNVKPKDQLASVWSIQYDDRETRSCRRFGDSDSDDPPVSGDGLYWASSRNDRTWLESLLARARDMLKDIQQNAMYLRVEFVDELAVAERRRNLEMEIMELESELAMADEYGSWKKHLPEDFIPSFGRGNGAKHSDSAQPRRRPIRPPPPRFPHTDWWRDDQATASSSEKSSDNGSEGWNEDWNETESDTTFDWSGATDMATDPGFGPNAGSDKRTNLEHQTVTRRKEEREFNLRRWVDFQSDQVIKYWINLVENKDVKATLGQKDGQFMREGMEFGPRKRGDLLLQLAFCGKGTVVQDEREKMTWEEPRLTKRVSLQGMGADTRQKGATKRRVRKSRHARTGKQETKTTANIPAAYYDDTIQTGRARLPSLKPASTFHGETPRSSSRYHEFGPEETMPNVGGYATPVSKMPLFDNGTGHAPTSPSNLLPSSKSAHVEPTALYDDERITTSYVRPPCLSKAAAFHGENARSSRYHEFRPGETVYNIGGYATPVSTTPRFDYGSVKIQRSYTSHENATVIPAANGGYHTAPRPSGDGWVPGYTYGPH